jgi:hypothetical protein
VFRRADVGRVIADEGFWFPMARSVENPAEAFRESVAHLGHSFVQETKWSASCQRCGMYVDIVQMEDDDSSSVTIPSCDEHVVLTVQES